MKGAGQQKQDCTRLNGMSPSFPNQIQMPISKAPKPYAGRETPRTSLSNAKSHGFMQHPTVYDAMHQLPWNYLLFKSLVPEPDPAKRQPEDMLSASAGKLNTNLSYDCLN